MRGSRAIHSSLEKAPRTVEEYEQKIVEADAIRLEILKAILDVLNL